MSTPPPPPPPSGPPQWGSGQQPRGSTPSSDPASFPASAWQAPPPAPRPAVPVAGVLLVVGAVLMIVGSFMTWFEIGGETYSGMDEIGGETRDGPIYVGMAVIIAALGAALLIWRRNLAVAIIALVVAGIGLMAALIDYGSLDDLEGFPGYEAGQGLLVVVLGSALAVAGGIVALAKRRG